jgi:hypothetical protein
MCVALAAGGVAAGPFDGIYKQTSESDCTIFGEDGGALRIEDGLFYGVDLECRMTRPVNVVDMDAKLYQMECSGEDTIWTERAMVLRAEDGIIMVWDGFAFKYDACSADEIAGVLVESVEVPEAGAEAVPEADDGASEPAPAD